MENHISDSSNPFYKKAADYWAAVPPTLEGVLGGFGFISEIDIKGSEAFLDLIFSLKDPPSKSFALDCGAGIGRITKHLLIKVFDRVDMIDQNENFLKVAEETIEPKTKMGTLYPTGLQNFKAEKKYDVIWTQWVLGHLTDEDFVAFFNMCSNSLAENGVIIVKENVTSSGKLEKDDVDSSVTRSLKHLLCLLRKSNLSVIIHHKQNNFPKGLYPVYLFGLRSAESLSKLQGNNSKQNNVQMTNPTTEIKAPVDQLSRQLDKLQIGQK